MPGALLGASDRLTPFNPNKPVRHKPRFIAEKTYPSQFVKETRFLHSTSLFTLYLVSK